MNAVEREIQRRKGSLNTPRRLETCARTCRYFGIARSGFYRWCDAEGIVNGGDGMSAYAGIISLNLTVTIVL